MKVAEQFACQISVLGEFLSQSSPKSGAGVLILGLFYLFTVKLKAVIDELITELFSDFVL